jgi:ferrous iron transport protein B
MSKLIVGLVGNPNCGKTTLFNELTGARQKVGNWPGVTVECKSGYFLARSQQIEVIDLPGIYQLSYSNDQQAVDEKIACDFVLNQPVDIIINIIDAAHLERHLYLTLQLLSIQIPLIVAVNMMDVAKRRQIEINLAKLQAMLGCPVVGLVANKGIGIKELKRMLSFYNFKSRQLNTWVAYPDLITKAISHLEKQIQSSHAKFNFCASWLAGQLLHNPESIASIKSTVKKQALAWREKIEKNLKEDIDILFADSFYSAANHISQGVSLSIGNRQTLTEKLDKIILNRWLGIPIFLLVMYFMFLFAINLGGAFQDFFDISSGAIFVQGVEQILNGLHSPSWLIALLAAGLGKGINTTLSFIPVIGAMFFFLAFLEGSGYMARASFVVDRLMRMVGLPGKSFVPMIVGFGCNVPAILAARILETPKERALTILMSPFMSCSARLAIFAVFTAAFFPSGGQNVVFALYFIGIFAAIFTGFILRKTLLPGEVTPLVLEFPAYHLPSLSILMKLTWHRLKSFVLRAGKLIVPICMVIGLLNAVNTDGTLNTKASSSNSILSSIGRTVTPLLKPMGIHNDNWPATVGLVTGILAKEVVIATLNTLYSQDSRLTIPPGSSLSLSKSLKEAIFSVPQNLLALKHSFSAPIVTKRPDHVLDRHVYGIMYQRFGGQMAAFAYLLFVLLYFPCVSATAVMAKELNKGWTLFSVIWSTGIAYGVATTFYQLATLRLHPLQSLGWVLVTTSAFGFILSIMRRLGSYQEMKESNYVIN